MNWKNITENAEVKRLLKQKIKIESEIRAIEPNALIMHELELLSIPSVVDCKHDFEPYYNWCSELAGYRCEKCGEEKD